MCSFGSCQTRFEFLSQFRKVRNAFECFVAQVQTHLPKTKRIWPMKINVICTVTTYYYVPESYSNNKIDVANHGNVAGIMDDNFKIASNSTHNVHYVTPFILIYGLDIPPVHPSPPHKDPPSTTGT